MEGDPYISQTINNIIIHKSYYKRFKHKNCKKTNFCFGLVSRDSGDTTQNFLIRECGGRHVALSSDKVQNYMSTFGTRWQVTLPVYRFTVEQQLILETCFCLKRI